MTRVEGATIPASNGHFRLAPSYFVMVFRMRLHYWLMRLSLTTAAGVCALAASGCAKPAVAAAPEPTPLAVPAVPPRLVGPVVVEAEAPEPVAEAPEPAPSPPAARPRSRATGESAGNRGEGQNADGSKAEPPVEPAASAAGPAPLLRTPDTADNVEAVRRVRDVMTRAQQNLSKVDTRNLSRGARTNYESARRFIDQAEDALKNGRIDYAKFVAEKAETFSTSLLKR